MGNDCMTTVLILRRTSRVHTAMCIQRQELGSSQDDRMHLEACGAQRDQHGRSQTSAQEGQMGGRVGHGPR